MAFDCQELKGLLTYLLTYRHGCRCRSEVGVVAGLLAVRRSAAQSGLGVPVERHNAGIRRWTGVVSVARRRGARTANQRHAVRVHADRGDEARAGRVVTAVRVHVARRQAVWTDGGLRRGLVSASWLVHRHPRVQRHGLALSLSHRLL